MRKESPEKKTEAGPVRLQGSQKGKSMEILIKEVKSVRAVSSGCHTRGLVEGREQRYGDGGRWSPA